MTGRVSEGITRGDRIEIEVDGARLPAFLGETVATALIAAGRRGFRRTERFGAARGVYCGSCSPSPSPASSAGSSAASSRPPARPGAAT